MQSTVNLSETVSVVATVSVSIAALRKRVHAIAIFHGCKNVNFQIKKI